MKVELLRGNTSSLELAPQEDTQYVLTEGTDHHIVLNMEKEGINVEFLCLISLKGKEDFKLVTESVHKVPNTSCMINIKGVLFDEASSDYVGKIIINKAAQQTVSFLEDNVLNVGEKSKNHSQPILEIEADDVKASHGATTGRVSEDQIYYLMSRGLTRGEAEKNIIEGFFEEGLLLIKDDKIREEVRSKLNA